MRLKDYPRSSLTLFAGLVLAVGALVLFSWLAEEVFEGDARHFDDYSPRTNNWHQHFSRSADGAKIIGLSKAK